MPVLIASAKSSGHIRKTSECKKPSTYARTQELLQQLGMNKKEWNQESKLKIMMKQVNLSI
jgi:phage terminase large subunit